MLSSLAIVGDGNNSLLKIAGGCEGPWRRKKECNLLIHILIFIQRIPSLLKREKKKDV